VHEYGQNLITKLLYMVVKETYIKIGNHMDQTTDLSVLDGRVVGRWIKSCWKARCIFICATRPTRSLCNKTVKHVYVYLMGRPLKLTIIDMPSCCIFMTIPKRDHTKWVVLIISNHNDIVACRIYIMRRARFPSTILRFYAKR
jgi:hypothetical protein